VRCLWPNRVVVPDPFVRRSSDFPRLGRVSETRFGEELVRLASADNFRDVSGPDTAYAGADGRTLRRGVAYRSNELQLTDTDVESLARLGIGAIYDLRTDHEVEAHPDAHVPGTRWQHLEVTGIPMDAVSTLADRRTAHDVMLQVYRGFVEVEGARAAFATLLRSIADSDAPVLFHCTAGKDRTGWAAALLLHLAGVDDETVLEDYLLTNTFSSATREKYLGLVREHLGADKVDVYERVMVADEAYLQAAYDAVTATYGDRLGYLRDGLGLKDATVSALRDRMLA
jgi:protein-tyrosine phosphatase